MLTCINVMSDITYSNVTLRPGTHALVICSSLGGVAPCVYIITGSQYESRPRIISVYVRHDNRTVVFTGENTSSVPTESSSGFTFSTQIISTTSSHVDVKKFGNTVVCSGYIKPLLPVGIGSDSRLGMIDSGGFSPGNSLYAVGYSGDGTTVGLKLDTEGKLWSATHFLKGDAFYFTFTYFNA